MTNSEGKASGILDKHRWEPCQNLHRTEIGTEEEEKRARPGRAPERPNRFFRKNAPQTAFS